MQLLHSLTRLVSRFRYPVSLPEDVAKDLGIHLPNTLSFKEFIDLMATPLSKPTKIRKFMSRTQAEAAFQLALRSEIFPSCSLYSYYFNRGWVVIALYFDEEARLRRAYLQCPSCERKERVDLILEEEPLLATASSQ